MCVCGGREGGKGIMVSMFGGFNFRPLVSFGVSPFQLRRVTKNCTASLMIEINIVVWTPQQSSLSDVSLLLPSSGLSMLNDAAQNTPLRN